MASNSDDRTLSSALRFVLSLALVAVAVIAGVATFGSETASPDASAPDGDTAVTSPPVTSGPNDTIAPPQGTLVEPNPAAVEQRPLSFDPSQVRPSENGVIVPFYGGVSPCFVLAGYEVQESSDTVVVTLTAGRLLTDEPVACIEIAQLYEVDVPLDSPLGDRTVVDGSVPS